MSTKKLNRRDFLRMAGLAGGGLVVAACAAPAPQVVEKVITQQVQVTSVVEKQVVQTQVVEKQVEKIVTVTPAPKGPVTIKFQSGWYVGSATDTLTPAMKMFNDKYATNIKGEIINLGTTTEDLLTAMAGGSANDIYHNYNFDATSLYARGTVLQIDDMINGNTIGFDPNMYLKSQWEAATYEGKTMAIPAFEGVSYPAFCWNKTLMKDVGDPGTGEVTWEQIIDWSKKATKTDAKGNLTQIGLDPLDSCGAFLTTWSCVTDENYISDDKKKFLFGGNAKYEQALNHIAALWQNAGADKLTSLNQQYDYWTGGAKSGFANGARLMGLNGGWQPGELSTTQKDKSWEQGYTWMPTLTGKKKVIDFGSTHTLIIPKICKNPVEAFTLEAFMASLDVAMLEYGIRGIACWSKPFAAKADFSKYPGLDWFMKAPSDADEVRSPNADSAPTGDEANKLWNRAVQEVIYKQKPAAQALNDIQTELQKDLDAFWAAQK
jgi:ABC-type glycerol-3-phosphate transport system substrate-binding protein